MTHPLSEVELKISNFKRFEDFTGIDAFMPINIIIGRNNAGKSALIDAVELCLTLGKSFLPLNHSRNGSSFKVRVGQIMDEKSIRTIFNEGMSSGYVGGNHWVYGKQFIGQKIVREYGVGWIPVLAESAFSAMQDKVPDMLDRLMTSMRWPFQDMHLVKISAERDISPEASSQAREVKSNGEGVTNLVRAFLLSDDLPRVEVETNLLNDLNQVYMGDNTFTNILVREDSKTSHWEIFLREEGKGDIRLSESGSSLKSVFILLATLRLVSKIKKTNWERIIFALEEPENNLHPSLLRRLLNFLALRREELGFTLIITTHSPSCIDWSTRRSDSQILHVKNVSSCSVVNKALGYGENSQILMDLDVKASDLLQANGVVWVEGPSDRIYIKKWIDIVSQGGLIEGVHYSIMFYGGKILSHFDALPPEGGKKLVSLLSINRNAAVIIDSDRRPNKSLTKSGRTRIPRMHINETKKRIKSEMEKIGSMVWVTEGREIENYLSRRVLSELAGNPMLQVSAFDDVPNIDSLAKFNKNKIAIAHAAEALLSASDIFDTLDLFDRLSKLIDAIARWNSLSVEPIKREV